MNNELAIHNLVGRVRRIANLHDWWLFTGHDQGDKLLFVKGRDNRNMTWRQMKRSTTVQNVWFNDFDQADMWFSGYDSAKEGK